MFGTIGKTQPVLENVVLDATGYTDTSITKVDCNTILGAVGREFVVSYKVVTNGTAPGSSKTFTPNIYWSDDDLAPEAASITLLAGRKQALSAVTVANTASVTRYYEYNTVIRPRARYMLITLDSSALSAGATLTVTMNFVRLASESV